MLVLVDALGLDILLLVEGATVLRGEVAVVLGAHAALFVVNAGLLMLQPAGFASGKLTALHSLSDAVLLVLLALIDGWIGICLLYTSRCV